MTNSRAKDRLAARGGRVARLTGLAIQLKRIREEFRNDPEGDQLHQYLFVTEWLEEVSVQELLNLQDVAKAAWKEC